MSERDARQSRWARAGLHYRRDVVERCSAPVAPRVSQGILFGAVLLLIGCGHPPQLSTSLSIEKKSNELIFVTLKVANVENSVTTPIAIEVTGQSRTGGHWEKPVTLLHPAAFVLNRKEQREITKLWRIQADGVRTTLLIKEQENGRLLKSEKAEKSW